MSFIAQSLPASPDVVAEGGRGESNTPFPFKICNDEGDAVCLVVGVGVDQVRAVLSLGGQSRRICETFTEHDFRPKGMPSMRMVGAWSQEGYKRTFRHFLGESGARLLYHRGSGALHVDVHFGGLVDVGEARRRVLAAVAQLAEVGVQSDFPTRVARADFTGDLLFTSAVWFRFVLSAFGSMVCERGRVMEPFRSSTLYLNGSRSVRTKRLGRIYDKGLERAASAGWDVPEERYMRIEAERVWGAERPQLPELTSELARQTFLDRFGAVGDGTVVAKVGLVGALGELRSVDAISVSRYEQLYTFLDHERMGLARGLYPRDTYLRRARAARSLGLQVPRDGAEGGRRGVFDVRSLVAEIARRF